ncbi:nucleoside deaminase [Bacillus atrophaeus]|jgi:tRNA(Arg) A34 adenosine deaminase TadA|uniref:Guanine deaminase n=1 Tax=Bacillus atrophaeus (strain 1942) TaxID=720555 RepID=A0ABM5LVC1_BACA1|nr:nucleoside deaminase [Bacillus atrophaeus]AMR63257.1 tRNA-specific adenosine deaminase [Bacillus subtilis subsp. globigii]ADP31814.1 guanine deaminase [Bacillus atrophaeus 1942]AIK49429.1 guanine deaminase [Bacillus atrophaeus subsp. globigii]EIM10477.1 guanine deaminase [Bacillus atrophaeus C89]KFK82149.1 guanine deaminase [Bacillus atrophaeus]
MNHNEFLQRAVELATEGVNAGIGGPFGAVIVKDGKIIAEGQNNVTTSNDPTAHAEVTAIRNACEALGSYQLDDCILYTSCEPCPMCLGAIYWARPKAVYYASEHTDAANAGFDDSFIYDEIEKPLSERVIPFRQVHLSEHLSPFQAWQAFADKKEY